jgi:hypothetical protein
MLIRCVAAQVKGKRGHFLAGPIQLPACCLKREAGEPGRASIWARELSFQSRLVGISEIRVGNPRTF